VSDVFKIADEKGISYEDVRSLDENEVYRLFYPDKYAVETIYELPDYEYVHSELKKVGVTLKLLWEEYKDQCQKRGTIPIGYSKFCDDYGTYTIEQNLTNHLEHKPGGKVEVDWSGPTMSYVDAVTGEIITVYLFVATLPYSQYSYAEPCLDMKMDSFLRCHVRMYEFFGGVPVRTVSDNLKTGVVSHPKEGEIVLTDDYEALGFHYETAIMPTGVKKPKQKPSVEGSVGKFATAIIAKLRNETFTSFQALKQAVAKKVDEFNHAPFQKREGSRYKVWLEEKESLRPLPAQPYEIAHWDYGHSVGLDFHVIFRKNRYSCPYQYSGKKVDLKVTDTRIEVYHKGERLTTHNRFPDYMSNRYSTHQEDMPPAFRKIKPWDDERILNWAQKIGPNTKAVINRIFDGVSIKEQGYNPSLAILKLSSKYSDARLETACELALNRGIGSPRYRHLNAILASNQDVLYMEQKSVPEDPDTETIGYLRGEGYYKRGREGGGAHA
jgi:transposase